MRKITVDAVKAFFEGAEFKRDNTTVSNDIMFLHGNPIAYWEDPTTIRMSLAGWPTPTTRERLNGLLQCSGEFEQFYQKDGVQWYGSVPIYDHQMWFEFTNVKRKLL